MNVGELISKLQEFKDAGLITDNTRIIVSGLYGASTNDISVIFDMNDGVLYFATDLFTG